MSTVFPEPQDDYVDRLLPEDDEPFAPDEALADLDDALTTFRSEDDLVVASEAPPPIARGWAFDVTSRRFVTGPPGHGPLETHGVYTLRVWAEMALNTDKGAHPIFSDEYGIERPFGEIGEHIMNLGASDYQARARQALTYHPRIVDARDFKFLVDPDSEEATADFAIVLDDETVLQIEGVRIGG